MTAFVNEMISKTLNQQQQTLYPAILKEASMDDEVGEILNIKYVNDPTRSELKEWYVSLDKMENYVGKLLKRWIMRRTAAQ